MQISTQVFDEAVAQFEQDCRREVFNRMQEAGEAAVEHNVEYGDYRNRTYRLRTSNYYEVHPEELVIGNSAPYASNVEARGYIVCSEGALLAEKILNGD